MNEDALRALIRQVVGQHLTPDVAAAEDVSRLQPLTLAGHASHYRYALPDSGGPCLIEPTVPCNHCGYCQSHGH